MEARNPIKSPIQEYLDEHILTEEMKIASPLMRGKSNHQDDSMLRAAWKIYVASKKMEKE